MPHTGAQHVQEWHSACCPPVADAAWREAFHAGHIVWCIRGKLKTGWSFIKGSTVLPWFKNWAECCAVIHYIQTGSKQEKIHIQSVLTLDYINPSLWHIYRQFQAQSNHTITQRERKKMQRRQLKKKKKKLKQLWSACRLHKIKDVFCLLTEQVWF